MGHIRPCSTDEHVAIVGVINAAAERYRNAIPPDCWHDPYMSLAQLEADIAAGTMFWAYVNDDGGLVGAMGIQPLRDVDLIRHAYVRPDQQGLGIGGQLLAHLESLSSRQILIGTWAYAAWAIGFYEAHGYTRIAAAETAPLLRTYWTISPRQVETSVVLAKPPVSARERAVKPAPDDQ